MRLTVRSGARLLAVLAAGSAFAWTSAAWASSAVPPGTGQAGWLRGVADLSASNAWAVGFSCVHNCQLGQSEVDRTLIMHWDGSAWKSVKSPNPNGNGRLNAVSAVSASNIWAVGSYCVARCGTSSARSADLIVHWNGAKWQGVPGPNKSGALVTSLGGVSAESPREVWAVGSYCAANCDSAAAFPERTSTWIVRWNGRSWRPVTSPNPGGQYGSSLSSVSAVSPSSAWAVGNYGTKQSFDNSSPGKSLVLHWNGSTWTQQPSPSFGWPAPGTVLAGVSPLSPSTALAVGSSYYSGCECSRSLALRWTGTPWIKSSSPNPGASGDAPIVQFFGVDAASRSDAWVVGYWESFTRSGALTLVARWDGTSWSTVSSPSATGTNDGSLLYGVSAESHVQAWAVGVYFTAKEQSRTLILRWNGTRWTRA